MPYNLRSRSLLEKTLLQHDDDFRPGPLDYAGYFTIDETHRVGVCEIQGKRAAQEDALAFDKNINVKFKTLNPEQQKQILLSTFQRLQQRFEQMQQIGSTACMVTSWLNQNKTYVVTANLGDSTAFLVATDKLGKPLVSKRLNTFHKPTDPEEKKRIEAEGGFVFDHRLNGSLAVSRAFGDTAFKGISHTPDIFFTEASNENAKNILVVIACDGVDESLSEQQILEAINKDSHLPPTDIANQLVLKAYKAGSCDNISVVVVPVSEKCVSAAVFDGHGGSVVSNALAQHFYTTFHEELRISLEANGKKKFEKLAAEQNSALQKHNLFTSKAQNRKSENTVTPQSITPHLPPMRKG